MKQIFRNNRLIAIALITVFSLSAAMAFANGGGKETAAQLNYVGTINNHQLFQLNVAGDEINNDFTIIIKDENGNQVYKENIKSGHFTKRFLFDTDELSNASLQFEVVNNKTKKSVLYEISSSVTLVKNILVNEVK